MGKWGKCMACRFQSGVRMRKVECVREAQKPGAEDILLEDSECIGPKPGSRELCNSVQVCPNTKREIDSLPLHMMQQIWFQTVPKKVSSKPQVRFGWTGNDSEFCEIDLFIRLFQNNFRHKKCISPFSKTNA